MFLKHPSIWRTGQMYRMHATIRPKFLLCKHNFFSSITKPPAKRFFKCPMPMRASDARHVVPNRTSRPMGVREIFPPGQSKSKIPSLATDFDYVCFVLFFHHDHYEFYEQSSTIMMQ